MVKEQLEPLRDVPLSGLAGNMDITLPALSCVSRVCTSYTNYAVSNVARRLDDSILVYAYYSGIIGEMVLCYLK